MAARPAISRPVSDAWRSFADAPAAPRLRPNHRGGETAAGPEERKSIPSAARLRDFAPVYAALIPVVAGRQPKRFTRCSSLFQALAQIYLTTITGGTRMILHFSAHLCACGVRGTRNRTCASGVRNEGDIGMALAGDLARFRIGSPVAAARMELSRSLRRGTPFCLRGSRILGHPRLCMGAGPERATNDSSYMTL